jgi:hypothetical protein
MVNLSGAKASDGHFVLLFESEHGDCKHTKHIARVLDYTFVFCKETKTPVAIYCGAEIEEKEDVITLVGELAEKYSLIGGLVKSSYFEQLADALLDVQTITLES